MLQVVYLPMVGFVESLNVGVAAALAMQRLFDLCPEARGDLPPAQRQVVMASWRRAILERLHQGDNDGRVEVEVTDECEN